MAVIVSDNKKIYAKEVKLENITNLGETDIKILKLLEEPRSIEEISKILNLSPQSVYYHIKKLKEKGLIECVEKIKRRGFEKSIYKLKTDAFFFVLRKNWKEIRKIENKDLQKILFPFVSNEEINCKIIVGAPFEHGIFFASSKDLHYVGYLCLLLGNLSSFIKYEDIIVWDTEAKSNKEILKENLVLIGGPITNTITFDLNKNLKIYFCEKPNWHLISTFSNKKYYGDTIGLVAKIKNPWNSEKWIFLLSGIKRIGTKAAILSLFNEEFVKKYEKDKELYAIVRGLDLNGDGKIEEIEILEYNLI